MDEEMARMSREKENAYDNFAKQLHKIQTTEKEKAEKLFLERYLKICRNSNGEIRRTKKFVLLMDFIRNKKKVFVPSVHHRPRFSKKSYYAQIGYDLLLFGEILPIKVWRKEQLLTTFKEIHPIRVTDKDILKGIDRLVETGQMPTPITAESSKYYVLIQKKMNELQRKIIRLLIEGGGKSTYESVGEKTHEVMDNIEAVVEDLENKGIIIRAEEREIYLPSV